VLQVNALSIMALIKSPLEDKPGFYTFVNPAFVTHIETLAGSGGGTLIFHLANQDKPVSYRFVATNAANAEKIAAELIKNHFGAPKSVDEAPRPRLSGTGSSTIIN
jgi:hypothetical protein